MLWAVMACRRWSVVAVNFVVLCPILNDAVAATAGVVLVDLLASAKPAAVGFCAGFANADITARQCGVVISKFFHGVILSLAKLGEIC